MLSECVSDEGRLISKSIDLPPGAGTLAPSYDLPRYDQHGSSIAAGRTPFDAWPPNEWQGFYFMLVILCWTARDEAYFPMTEPNCTDEFHGSALMMGDRV
jgi:hypothetical protein